MSIDKKNEGDKHTRDSVPCFVKGQWPVREETFHGNRAEMIEKGSCGREAGIS